MKIAVTAVYRWLAGCVTFPHPVTTVPQEEAVAAAREALDGLKRFEWRFPPDELRRRMRRGRVSPEAIGSSREEIKELTHAYKRAEYELLKVRARLR